MNDNFNNYLVFSLDYIKLYDYVFFTVNQYDSNNEEVDSDFYTLMPFKTESGDIDIKMDYYGIEIYYSETIKLDSQKGGNTKSGGWFTPIIYDGPGGVIHVVLDISHCITDWNQDNLSGLAAQYILVPSLSTNGPLYYLFYLAKASIAYSNYTSNKLQTNPTTFIHNQGSNDYNNWKFGMLSDYAGTTIDFAGCECIALFNLLMDCQRPEGESPDLASIIALVELLNADLFGGVFGTMTLPTGAIDVVTNAITNIYNSSIKPVIESFIDDIAENIYNYYLSNTSWLAQYLAGLIIQIVEDIIGYLLIAVASATEFLLYYFNCLNDIGDVIDILIEDHNYTGYSTLSSFSNAMGIKYQGIVSFWNETDPDGNINILGRMHTVYVKRDTTINKYKFYNLDCTNVVPPFDYISQGIASCNSGPQTGNQNVNYAPNQYLYGYVMSYNY